MAGPDAAAGEATESIELGFRCVKFKVGYSHVGQDRAVIRLGENLWGPHDLTKCLAAGGLGLGASDFMMLDVMKIGGITGWLRTASQTEAAGLPVNSARS